MSEFKVGDQIVKTNPNIKHAHIRTVIAITKSGGAVLDYSGYGYKAPRVRHATPEEIAAGKRLDDIKIQVSYDIKPNDLGVVIMGFDPGRDITHELETLDHEENHISPNCKTIGEQS